MRRLVPLVLMLALSGCEGSRILVVEMDGGLRWEGYYTVNEGERVQIRGPGALTEEIVVPSDGKLCWVLVNRGEHGSIVAYLKVSTIFGTDRRGEGSTAAPYGEIRECSE
jgi:hypothetical protein